MAFTRWLLTDAQLYLIHWPVAFKPGDSLFPKTNNDTEVDLDRGVSISETWKGRRPELITVLPFLCKLTSDVAQP